MSAQPAGSSVRPLARPGTGRGGRRAGLLLAPVLAASALAGFVTAPPASAQGVAAVGSADDVAAVRAAAEAYRQALARGDAAAVKAAWTADADIVDGWGHRLAAADIAVAPPGAGSAAPRPEVRPAETRVRFLTRDVAIEDGSADVVLPGMTNPVEGWFSAMWIRRGDGWKLAGVREAERPVSSEADMLADLDWMVGDWTLVPDGADGAKPAAAAEMRVTWDAGHAFLVREVRVPGVATDGGSTDAVDVHQRIGWDPLVKRIRSWSFSSDGSRSEATWSRDGSSWVATQSILDPTGRQSTVVNLFTYDGSDRCVWRTLPQGVESDDGRPVRATWVRTSGSTKR